MEGTVLGSIFSWGDKGPSEAEVEAELAERKRAEEARHMKELLLDGVKDVSDINTYEKVYPVSGKPILIQKGDEKFICFNSGSYSYGSKSVSLHVIPLIEKEFNFPFDIRLLDDNIDWNTGNITGYRYDTAIEMLQRAHGGARGVGKISNKSKKRKNKRSKRYKRR